MLEIEARHYLHSIKAKWLHLQEKLTIFAYRLNVQEQQILPGNFGFYTELNVERSQLRRVPQSIDNLKPSFNSRKFNFNKINPAEIILTILFKKSPIFLIINKSPLTQYHSLICPEMSAGHAQRLTPLSLDFSVTFLRFLDDKDCRVGYNSPGALASVNHLHLHLIHMKQDLYIDKIEMQPLAHGFIMRLNEDAPTEAVCFLINKTDTNPLVQQKLFQLYTLTEWLCAQNMPHNLFITHDRLDTVDGALKIFVFARENYCIIKDLATFNVGFCELAGYVPIGVRELYEKLSETQIISKIRQETGDVYRRIYEYISTKL